MRGLSDVVKLCRAFTNHAKAPSYERSSFCSKTQSAKKLSYSNRAKSYDWIEKF